MAIFCQIKTVGVDSIKDNSRRLVLASKRWTVTVLATAAESRSLERLAKESITDIMSCTYELLLSVVLLLTLVTMAKPIHRQDLFGLLNEENSWTSPYYYSYQSRMPVSGYFKNFDYIWAILAQIFAIRETFPVTIQRVNCRLCKYLRGVACYQQTVRNSRTDQITLM